MQVRFLSPAPYGWMAERFKAADLKSVDVMSVRGFESYSTRQRHQVSLIQGAYSSGTIRRTGKIDIIASYIAGSFKGQDLGLSQNRLTGGRIQRMEYEILGQHQFLRPKTDDVSSILTPAARPQYPSSCR